MSWQNIPTELKKLNQWLGASDQKEPINPKTGHFADVTNKDEYGTFEEACSCGTPNIGFVFTKNDPYIFIDLDTGKDLSCTDLHTSIIERANSYTETSISEKSSHIIIKGVLDRGLKSKHHQIEIYPHSRFMVATGWQFYGDIIEERQSLLDELVELIGQTRPEIKDILSEKSRYSDEALYKAICEAENGAKFKDLFEGKWFHYDEYCNDHSRADLGLLTILDFYSHDVEQVIRVFKKSQLYRSTKGRRNSDGTDYILRTLKTARAMNEATIPPMIDAATLMERAKNVLNVVETVDDITKTISPPPGLVGEIAQYIYSSAIRPVPEVALIGALAMMAGIVGRQFNVSGSGLNLYLILLAPTGTGKEGASSGISNLLARVREAVPNVDQFIGPADFASGPALIRILDEQPCLFSIIGEFGMRVQAMADPRANGAERTLQKALLNIYSKSGWHQTESSIAYSEREKNTKTLFAPALTILGETTPETFFENLSERQIMSGLLPRFMFLEYKGDRPPRNAVSAFCEPPPELVDRIANVATTIIQMQNNNSCAPVLLSSDAQKLMDEFDSYCDIKINNNIEVYKHLWNRAHLKALRLAGVIAVGCNSIKPLINSEIAKWAIDFVMKDVSVIEHRFNENLVGTGEHQYESEIRTAVEDYLVMSKEKRQSYKVPDKIIELQIIPYTYLRRRLRRVNGFKNDRRGVAIAIQLAIKDLCEAGILQSIPPLVRKEQYRINSDLYVVGESW